jgi:hypothetical protein
MGSGDFELKTGDAYVWGCSSCRDLAAQKRQPKRTKLPALRALPLIRQKPIKEIAAALRVDPRTAQRCATSPWTVSDRLYYRYVLVNLDATPN